MTSPTSISGLPEAFAGNLNQEVVINDGGITRKIKVSTLSAAIASTTAVQGVATATSLPANTYNNGSSGVGATLTGVAFGALTVDGVALVAGMSVLVKDELNAANNGLYLVSVAGSSTASYILTRSLSMNTPTQFAGAVIVVGNSGTVNANTFWVCSPNAAVVVGTTAISFVSPTSVSIFSSSVFNAAFLSWMASLPTTLPTTRGVAWNNGGIPCVS